MARKTTTFAFETHGAGLYEITGEVSAWLRDAGVSDGLLTLFCQHTSAGLLITENASSAVHRDLVRWLGGAVPEGADYEHSAEGPDDMPAHIKTVLTGNSATVPVSGGRPMLGTWQGIYLAEHRRRPHTRTVVAHVAGD